MLTGALREPQVTSFTGAGALGAAGFFLILIWWTVRKASAGDARIAHEAGRATHAAR